MQYIIPILIGISTIAIWQGIVFFLQRRDKKNRDLGGQQLVNHIFNHVKKTGEINVTLDGVKMILVEKVDKKNKK